MKCIIALILLVASTLAIDNPALKQRTLNRPEIDEKHEESEWDNLKINPKFKAFLDKAEVKSKPEEPRNQTRIVGGKNAYYGQFPWQVSIQSYSQCGGVIISYDWVLTSAACVYRVDSVVVIIGAHHPDGSGDAHSVKLLVESTDVIIHPGFDTHKFDNNIALLYLPKSIDYNDYVQPALLFTRGSIITLDRPFIFTGWGSVTGNPDGISPVLKYVQLIGTPRDECARYGDFFTENDVCMDVPVGSSPCYGDLGGPLVLDEVDPSRRYLVGILSFINSHGCLSDYQVAFTLVHLYFPWIQKITGLPLVF